MKVTCVNEQICFTKGLNRTLRTLTERSIAYKSFCKTIHQPRRQEMRGAYIPEKLEDIHISKLHQLFCLTKILLSRYRLSSNVRKTLSCEKEVFIRVWHGLERAQCTKYI